jgi:uncharacterized protein
MKSICNISSLVTLPFLLLALPLLMVSSWVAVSPAQAASFDCSRAIEPDEVAVCANPHLSQMDTEMGALWYSYSKMPMLMGASGARQDEATAFLRRRAACGADVGCLRQVYRARIGQLKQDIAQAAANISP